MIAIQICRLPNSYPNYTYILKIVETNEFSVIGNVFYDIVFGLASNLIIGHGMFSRDEFSFILQIISIPTVVYRV